MSQKVTGLASAFDPKPATESGITSLTSRFDTPEKSKPTSTKISDLASRFGSSDVPLPTPSPPPPSRKPQSTPTKPKTPVKSDEEPSRKVSDLSKAFSNIDKPSMSDTFTAAQSAFEKGESRVAAFSKKLDNAAEGPTSRVAGVARAFEKGDVKPGKKEHVKDMEKRGNVENNVDPFASIASRFETGNAARGETDVQEGGAKERFLDAAKRFGGS